MPAGVPVAPTLPEKHASLVPTGFDAGYFLFTTNTIGTKRISLFAVGSTNHGFTPPAEGRSPR